MAYMNQEKKAKLVANLKKVIPQGWKYSVSVRNHSTICLTIQSAPVDLIASIMETRNEKRDIGRFENPAKSPSYYKVNEYSLENQFSGDLLTTFEAIKTALNDGNHDRSDIQSDYFDVGWYTDISIGRWDKPFSVVEQLKAAA